MLRLRESSGLQKMMAVHDVVTLQELEGYRASADLGVVVGSASRPKNLFKATFRSLGMLIGLAPSELLGDAEHLRNDALDDMRLHAERLGANAIVGVAFAVTEGADGSCTVTATGRALSIEPQGAPDDRN